MDEELAADNKEEDDAGKNVTKGGVQAEVRGNFAGAATEEYQKEAG